MSKQIFVPQKRIKFYLFLKNGQISICDIFTFNSSQIKIENHFKTGYKQKTMFSFYVSFTDWEVDCTNLVAPQTGATKFFEPL